MTVKDEILSRPVAVQIVIKAHITKASLDDEAPDYERYGADALAWWDAIVSDYRASDPDAGEAAIADRVIELLRKQDVWGRILREGTV
jgi:hypothetical protein